eukprot:3797358-Pleurochrysis_carterae.AAC.3
MLGLTDIHIHEHAHTRKRAPFTHKWWHHKLRTHSHAQTRRDILTLAPSARSVGRFKRVCSSCDSSRSPFTRLQKKLAIDAFLAEILPLKLIKARDPKRTLAGTAHTCTHDVGSSLTVASLACTHAAGIVYELGRSGFPPRSIPTH